MVMIHTVTLIRAYWNPLLMLLLFSPLPPIPLEDQSKRLRSQLSCPNPNAKALQTLGKSARSANIPSLQHKSFKSCTSFTSFPWLRLSRIAALTSPAVFIRCAGERSSDIAGGAEDEESNAKSAIVRSSSARNSGLSSPLGASSSCANFNASVIRPCRMCSISFCC